MIHNLTKNFIQKVHLIDDDHIEAFLENKDRSIKILSDLKKKIDASLEEDQTLNSRSQQILAPWIHNYPKILRSIFLLDQELIQALERSQRKTSQEISSLSKTRFSLKGYRSTYEREYRYLDPLIYRC